MSERKKKILRLFIATIAIVVIALALYFILKAIGVTDMNKLRTLIEETGIWIPVVFIVLQVVITTVLCVFPGTSLAFIMLALSIWEGKEWIALIITCIAVWLSSILMFFIGDKLGEKVVIKLVGEADLRKAQD